MAEKSKPGAMAGHQASGDVCAEEASRPRNASKGALRQQRYRARKRDGVTPSPVTGDVTADPSPLRHVTQAIDTLLDTSECVTANELLENIDPLAAEGLADDLQILIAWLGVLRIVAGRASR